MRHGWSAWLLTGLLLSPWCVAKEITPQQAQRWEQDLQILTKADELYQYVLDNDISSLQFALQRLALPQQEVIRYLLLQHIEDQQLILSPQVARFVQAQLGRLPAYQIREQGDGYEVVVPVYNSAAVASRLLKKQAGDHAVLEFVLLAEQRKLKLTDWLSGDSLKAHQALLISELDGLSPQALDHLKAQLLELAEGSWIPASAVVARFAELSQDPRVYELLWRMRADNNSRRELARLAEQGDEFAIRQIIAAAANPSLADPALDQLTRLHPLPVEVKTFLLERLKQDEFTELVATRLRDQGHSSWLEQLSRQKNVNSNILKQVLSQASAP